MPANPLACPSRRFAPGSVLLALILVGWMTPSLAHDASKSSEEPRISLSVAVSETVPNDVMAVNLTIQERGENLAEVSDAVNRRAQEVAETIQEVEGVEVDGQTYSTYREQIRTETSRDDNDRFVERWVVSQSLTLRYQLTADEREQAASKPAAAFGNPFTALTALVGELQGRDVELGSVNFSVSRELQREVRNRLLPEALRALREQAATAARALDATSVRPHDIQVDDRLGAPNEQFAARMDMAVMAQAAPAAPKFDAGNSDIHMTVSGRFEMLGAPAIELHPLAE